MQTIARNPNMIKTAAAVAGMTTLLLFQTLSAQTAAPTAQTSLPSWITELSVSAKESYDDNVFGSKEVLQAGYPDLVDKSAWITSVGARFYVSASALAGGGKDLLVIGYAPTLNNFSRYSSENNKQHRLALQSKGKVDAWSWALDNTTTYVDGSKQSLQYTGYSAYGIAFPRERRNQWQDTGKASVRYDIGSYFVRAASSLTYYDLLTEHHVATGTYVGWLNFVDRYDFNGGLDFGWNVVNGTALTVGWRHGYQYQQAFPWAASVWYTSSSHYDRALLGVEGKPLSWLSLNLSVGPDFRHYDAPVETCGVVHPNQTAFYIETNATATLGKADNLILTGKQWRWVSSTGRVAYDDKNWQLAWKHTLSSLFNFQLAGQFQQGQYTSYPAAVSTTYRNDLFYTGSAQIQWTPTKKIAVTLEYAYQRAENAVDTGSIAGREFRHNTYGLGMKYMF